MSTITAQSTASIIVSAPDLYNAKWQSVSGIKTLRRDGKIQSGTASVSSTCGSYSWVFGWEYNADNFDYRRIDLSGEATLVSPEAARLDCGEGIELDEEERFQVFFELDNMHDWCDAIFNELNHETAL